MHQLLPFCVVTRHTVYLWGCLLDLASRCKRLILHRVHLAGEAHGGRRPLSCFTQHQWARASEAGNLSHLGMGR